MKLEVGKKYATRDGRTVEISASAFDGICFYGRLAAGEGWLVSREFAWLPDGRTPPDRSGRTEYPSDLVREVRPTIVGIGPDGLVVSDLAFAVATFEHDLYPEGYAPGPAGDSTQATTFFPLPVVDAMKDESTLATIPAMGSAEGCGRWKPPLHLVGGVGDIKSDAKGSGARYNAGKLPVELLSLSMVGTSYLARGGLTEAQAGAAMALEHIGDYQSRTRGTEALYAALLSLGDLTDVWRECVQVFEYGMRKYAAWNWAKGMAWSIPIACAGRHAIFGILAGDHLDPESKLPHRGHIACNIVMLIAYAETFHSGDDRPAAGLLAANEEQRLAAA
jgi:hypothetical protein